LTKTGFRGKRSAIMIVPPSPPSPKALRYPGYRNFLLALVAGGFAVQIMSVAVGWQVWALTGNPLYLGLIGLVQFLPALVLVLVTGAVADRFNRRWIVGICLLIEGACALALLSLVLLGVPEIWLILVTLTALGVARAFLNPAVDSLTPNLIPEAALANALTLKNTAWQLSSILGPVAGGLLYGLAAWVPYAIALALVAVAVVAVVLIPKPPQRRPAEARSLDSLLAGFRYIWNQKLVLGAISLDLFAVLLGGATALMPIFASEVLAVGPLGLGLLRAAPGIGAIAMAVVMVRVPIRDHAGAILFGFVFAFGVFTLLFGLSTAAWLSIPLLVLMGAADMVSVVIRETLLQLWTPDEVRGRVSAVNRVFIGASNELGEFRAGVAAFWIGAQAAVVVGGVGTMLVAVTWPLMFPGLARARSLDHKGVPDGRAAART
jgi:MFS family permease